METVYFASALFNSRETLFNQEICRRLESGEFGKFRVLLPQRDGFEFSSLGAMLAARLEPRQVSAAVETIIYTLDMGGFLSRADSVVAVLDEPLDEGVLVELSYARRLGLPCVGIRTDTRTPYGAPGDSLGGIHFFAAFQCTSFLMCSPASGARDLDAITRTVVERLRDQARGARAHGDEILEQATRHLFKGVNVLGDDLHDPKVLGSIVDNYLAGRATFERLAPRVSTVRAAR
jgi:nucleoside 2-deoxyribosyltransferase